jgi:DNA-binding CsgD family transcriptional regulator
MNSKPVWKEECRADSPIGELVTALVRHSDTPDSPGGQQLLLDVEVDGVRCVLRRLDPSESVSLSPRELEIARMVAQGYPNKTIGAVLDISTWTVGTYLRRIFAKYGVTSRAAMVAKMLDQQPRRDS